MTSLPYDQSFVFSPRKARTPETRRETQPMVRTSELRRLLQHWYKLKGARPLPLRADLDPVEIAYCLGNVALVEIEPPFRPRYRLVGTKLADLLGEDPTGRYLDEMYSTAIRSEALAAYRRTIETGEPDYTERVFNLLFLKLGYYRLLLPFSHRSEGRADLVLAAFFPTDRSIRRAVDWLGRVPEHER